jgi:ribosomal protein S18 acetylase RimI-like enzyme
MEDEVFTVKRKRGDKLTKEETSLILMTFTSGFKIYGGDINENKDNQRAVLAYINDTDKVWYFIYSSLDEIVSIVAVLENMLTRSDGTVNPSYMIEIQSVATLPSYRKRGFIRVLLDEICKNQKSGLWLDVNEENDAFQLYKKVGFKIYEEIPQEELFIREKGRLGRRFRMIKRC